MSFNLSSLDLNLLFLRRSARIGVLQLVVLCPMVLSNCSPETEADQYRIWIGGDFHFGEGRSAVLEPLSHLLQGAIGFVNLEGPLHGGKETHVDDSGRVWLFNSPRTLPQQLAALNIQAVGTANNHQHDAGSSGVHETERHLKQAGILSVGGSSPIRLLKLPRLDIVLTAHDLTDGITPTLSAELQSARKRGDILISTFHVTGPPSYLPSPQLRKAVEIALEAGASVIASHGSHAPGPVERRGDTVIAWGLGNLAFNCKCTDEKDGLVLALLLNSRNSGERIAEAGVVPIDAGLRGNPSKPARNPELIFDLLEAIGSTELRRQGQRASF